MSKHRLDMEAEIAVEDDLINAFQEAQLVGWVARRNPDTGAWSEQHFRTNRRAAEPAMQVVIEQGCRPPLPASPF